jgi:glycosyltransferase involved in cell wall biosynthesis
VDLEVVIVDDGSNPAFSLDPELRNDKRIRIVRITKNQGPAHARNLGVAESKGDWIAFLDSDDVWTGNYLGMRLDAAAEAAGDSGNRPLAFAAGFTLFHAASGTRSHVIPIGSDRIERFASACWHCPGSTLLMQRKCFLDLGGFDTRLRRLEDYEFFLRFGMAGGVLAVFPSVVAEIHIEKRPAIRLVRAAAERIMRDHESKLDREGARRMRAYLALERLSASYYSHHLLNAGYWFTASMWHYPRARLHLERWWMPPESIAAGQ